MAGPGRPGRQSAAAAGSPAPSSAPAKGPLRLQLRAPDYLPDDAREMFNAILINSKPNHFVVADVPMLAAYCEAHIQARNCARHVREGQGSDSVIKAQRNALSAIFQLSMRLRICPQSRLARTSVRADTRPPNVSYYDIMEMDSDAADDNTGPNQ
jgi:phage terminase small subunit